MEGIERRSLDPQKEGDIPYKIWFVGLGLLGPLTPMDATSREDYKDGFDAKFVLFAFSSNGRKLLIFHPSGVHRDVVRQGSKEHSDWIFIGAGRITRRIMGIRSVVWDSSTCMKDSTIGRDCPTDSKEAMKELMRTETVVNSLGE